MIVMLLHDILCLESWIRCVFSLSLLVYNGGFLREGTSSTRLAVKECIKMNQLFDITISKIVWYACRILHGQSLHRLSTCLIPVYSVRSSVEWFPVSATVSHLCVKQLGLKWNKVNFDSHKAVGGKVTITGNGFTYTVFVVALYSIRLHVHAHIKWYHYIYLNV